MVKLEDINAYAEAAHRATVGVRDFLDTQIVPVIHAQVATNSFEQALNGLYYRQVLWGRTMAALTDPNHFQAVRSGSRTAFELHLDIHHLAAEPALAEKMFAFSEVWKYNSSVKMVNFLQAHPEFDEPVYRHQKTRASDAAKKNEYEALLDQFWPSATGKRNVPSDWFGGSIYEKARSAGPEFELAYRDEYGFASLFSHSGLVPVDGISNEALIIAFARGHLNFQKSYLRATAIVCKALHLLEAKPGLQQRLHEMESLYGTILARILAVKGTSELPGT